MAISLYDATVASFIRVLDGVDGFLERALAHFRETGVDPESVLEARIIEDMLPLRAQLGFVRLHSWGAVEGVRGGEFAPQTGGASPDYAGQQASIRETRTALAALSPQDIEALEGRPVVFRAGEMQIPFTAETFLLTFSLPNLHFHATTAYDILRMSGAPLGKRDYLGGSWRKAA